MLDTKKKYRIAFGAIVVAGVLAVLYGGMQKSVPQSQNISTASPQLGKPSSVSNASESTPHVMAYTPSQVTAVQTSAPVPATEPRKQVKQHLYVMEEDGEYGYEGALSENDRNAGKSVNPIRLFRYLGEKNGTYTVQSRQGQVAHNASCKEPCEFIKIQTIYAGQVADTETVRSTGTAIIDAVLMDARSGALEKYKAPSRK